MKTDNYVQIDVMEINQEKQVARCYLYTPEGTITMYIKQEDYEHLTRNGFFIRDGKQVDSAGVLNTTLAYYSIPVEEIKKGSVVEYEYHHTYKGIVTVFADVIEIYTSEFSSQNKKECSLKFQINGDTLIHHGILIDSLKPVKP